MTQSGSVQSWQLRLASCLAVGGAIAFYGDCSLAQVIPDPTLGAESSAVTPNVVINGLPSDQIDGGAVRGTNLFHSFLEFNIAEGQAAYFTNPAGIENILSRVTGGNPSEILGKLGVLGDANLFLINPSGIIFGLNASLDVRGSFVASTASSLNFADGTQFSATAPQTPPLLTISVPIGLQFGATPASILNQSQASPNGATNSLDQPVGLQVLPGKTLALVGGDVVLEGGNLTAQGGHIELGSVAANSLVSLIPTDKGWALSYEGVQSFQDILLTQRTVNDSKISSFVDTSGAGGGDIQVQGRRVILTDGSKILATTSGAKSGGTLRIIASEFVELLDPGTSLTTQTRGEGAAGAITISTGEFIVRDGAQVSTDTSGGGSGGLLTVNAESVELIGTSPSGTYSGLVSATAAAGEGGDITLDTNNLLIQNGAAISTESSGILDSDSGQFTPATGAGGNLTVTALSVELTDGGFMSSTTQGSGKAGDLTLNTETLLVSNRSQISAATLGEGQGGTLTVNASESVELINGSVVTLTKRGSGNAGDIRIATEELIVRDGATVNVSSTGTGDAGNLEVTASSIFLNDRGTLSSESVSGKGGGNISLQEVDLLLLRGNSQITTNAGGLGNGGNIDIDTDILVALEDSDITANAIEGRGGNIQITTQGLFLSPDSQITATSQRGIDGVVEINNPEVDPTSGVVNLPEEVVDVSGLIVRGCQASGGQEQSAFAIAHSNSMPRNSGEAIAHNTTEIASVAIAPQTNNRSRPTPPQIVEAQGWIIDANGKVVLTATPPAIASRNSPQPPECRAQRSEQRGMGG